MLIGEDWVVGALSGDTSRVINPATGELIVEVARAGDKDVDAAKLAFDRGLWRLNSADDKSRILWRISELIETHLEEIAQAETRNLGAPIWLTRFMIASSAEAFRYYAGWPSKIHGRTSDASKPGQPTLAYTRKEPIGVAALITPRNFPFLAASWSWLQLWLPAVLQFSNPLKRPH
jgi:phenylacetaldehyde dehydrogenase